jgi:hypothetical protein
MPPRDGSWEGRLGQGVLAAVAGFAGSVTALHAAQPELDPLTEAVSYYVHGTSGEWLTVSLLVLGLGSLALARLLRRTYEGAGAGIVSGGVAVWGCGLVVGAAFPADPRGSWSGPPSVAGLVHGGAALLAFLALAAAALTLARGLRADPAWRPAGRSLVPLGVACVLGLAGFFASLWPTLGAERPPVLLGLTERLLLAAYSAWLWASARHAMAVGAGRTA